MVLIKKAVDNIHLRLKISADRFDHIDPVTKTLDPYQNPLTAQQDHQGDLKDAGSFNPDVLAKWYKPHSHNRC